MTRKKSAGEVFSVPFFFVTSNSAWVSHGAVSPDKTALLLELDISDNRVLQNERIVLLTSLGLKFYSIVSIKGDPIKTGESFAHPQKKSVSNQN